MKNRMPRRRGRFLLSTRRQKKSKPYPTAVPGSREEKRRSQPVSW